MSFVVGSFIAWIGTKKKSIANIYERKILLPHSQNNAAFCCRREERRHYAGAKMPKKIIIQSNWWFVWCNMWVCAACVFVCVTWKKQAKWIREKKKRKVGISCWDAIVCGACEHIPKHCKRLTMTVSTACWQPEDAKCRCEAGTRKSAVLQPHASSLTHTLSLGCESVTACRTVRI